MVESVCRTWSRWRLLAAQLSPGLANLTEEMRVEMSQQVVSTPLPVAGKGVSASYLHSITRYTGRGLRCLSKLSPLHYPVHR
ncbi:hypothetical protein RRG08_007426 [Elysia crispata]|uniref:Uncharacterized protein n=1 Tax=Elysia crispata TaxID=231223 RepID=A0AAE1B7G6_9GAST|nr:hypothetical protein RRG08_007426 [Elysia crispata]